MYKGLADSFPCGGLPLSKFVGRGKNPSGFTWISQLFCSEPAHTAVADLLQKTGAQEGRPRGRRSLFLVYTADMFIGRGRRRLFRGYVHHQWRRLQGGDPEA